MRNRILCPECYGSGYTLERGVGPSPFRRRCAACSATGEVIARPHQNQTLPGANKFHTGNGDDNKHYWITPPTLYTALDAEFHFDFDPCPHPLPGGFDGLTCDWGRSNYVNPPFGSIVHQGKKKGPTAWVRKSIAESRKGKLVVLVYPVDKWVLMLLTELGTAVRNLGDVRWLATEDGSAGKGTGRHIAAFVLDGRPTLKFVGLPGVRIGDRIPERSYQGPEVSP